MKDVKLVADVSEQPITDYTTFWGKIKGQLEKQADLYEWLQRLYNNITELFKERLILSNRVDKIENITVDEEERNIKDIHLERDYLDYELNKLEESSESSEEFINDIKVPTFEFVDEALNELYFTKQDNLTFKAGRGINVTLDESSEKILPDEVTIINTLDIESGDNYIVVDKDSSDEVVTISTQGIPTKLSDLPNDTKFITRASIEANLLPDYPEDEGTYVLKFVKESSEYEYLTWVKEN